MEFTNAVINDSMFSRYARKHCVTVNTQDFSYDLIMLKFDYPVNEDDSDKNNIKPAVKASDLREMYYNNGITITWRTFNKETREEIIGKRKTITYRMLMRNPGKAKEGHCIFVNERIHKNLRDYITMGLWDKMPDEKGAKIVEMSAYAPLITATATGFINIPLDNIFVVEDEKVSTFKSACSVKTHEVTYFKEVLDYSAFESYINTKGFTFYKKTQNKNHTLKYIKQSKTALIENGIDINKCPLKKKYSTREECFVDNKRKQAKITNTLWDGMGLCDESIFPKNKEGFIYCRSHFFKSCLFRGNIQDYFKDHYKDDYHTAYATDMFGRRIKVTDIKVIVTENSLKWTKFLDLMSKSGNLQDGFKYYDKIMKKDNYLFQIVKDAHSSKYGDLQRSSFQMNNTLLTTDEATLRRIAGISIDYCNKLKLYDEAFLEHLRITGSARYSINNVLIDLYHYNDKFRNSSYFKEKRDKEISEFKTHRLMFGKLFQNGDNLTICGNPIAMLMKVRNSDCKQENCFEVKEDCIQCYTEQFAEGEHIAGFRSPHNSPNNIIHLENVYPEALRKYFPRLSKNVIVINGIGTDVQNRLNGQDLDSDSLYATNQADIVKLARKAYIEFPTIINDIQSTGTSEYDKSMTSYAIMDINISSAQYEIGRASNWAQLALSYWFNDGCNNEELENIFIILSVLAQVAIDSAKKNFDINVSAELDRITKLGCMKRKPKYPKFYANIQKYNNKKTHRHLDIKEEDVGFFNCPMDILYNVIDEGVINLQNHKRLNTKRIGGFNDIFEYKADHKKIDRKQTKKIISIVTEYKKAVGKINEDSDSYYEEKMNKFEVCAAKLRKLSISQFSMSYLIDFAFKNSDIRDALLVALYDRDRDKFLKCFKKTEKTPHKVA